MDLDSSEANNDFEEFIKKSSDVDFLSFGETRKNLSSRGSRYEEIVKSSQSINKICEYIKSEEFFKKCIQNSTEAFNKKGLKIKIPKFNQNSYDSLRFAKKFSILWGFNKLRFVLFQIPSFFVKLNIILSLILIIFISVLFWFTLMLLFKFIDFISIKKALTF